MANGCATCGAAITIVDASGNTKKGEFYEQYECANGHIGRISGDCNKHSSAWTHTGAVFQERVTS